MDFSAGNRRFRQNGQAKGKAVGTIFLLADRHIPVIE